ncbi:MAG: hypothetical protein N2204_03955, partial [Anaerolineae bacterium]|nr:hypothetical protein [Anaerolineae bacterium]
SRVTSDSERIAQPGLYRQIYELQTRIEEELAEELTSFSGNGHEPGVRGQESGVRLTTVH